MNKKQKITQVFFLFIMFTILCKGQSDTFKLDLKTFLFLVIENAYDLEIGRSEIAENQLSLSEFEERLKPNLVFNGNLPNLSRTITARPLPNGQDNFLNYSTMFNNIGLSLNYQLLSSGGTISVSSNLQRLDILRTQEVDYLRTYFFTPVSVNFSQPFFQFNELKWQKQALQISNQELNAKQILLREEVIQDAITLFKRAFEAQLMVKIASQRIEDLETLFKIKNELFEIGKADKIEILKLNLDLKNNFIALEQSQTEQNKIRLEICDFLRINRSTIFFLLEPPNLATIEISPEDAVKKAQDNIYYKSNFSRRLWEKEIDGQRARKDLGAQMNLGMSLGLNKTSEDLNELYSDLLDRQTLSLSLEVPINNRRRRLLNEEIASERILREKLLIEQDKKDLTREVLNAISDYNHSKSSIEIKEQNKETTEEIYQLTQKQFALGNKSIIELNVASNEREQALLDFYQSILLAVEKLYELRKLCFYDFIEGKNISNW